MSETKPLPIDGDDPGLTAFALGELEGSEAAHYAEAVAASPELQSIVQEIQAEARILCDELQLEPQVALSAERRAEIVAQACPESRRSSPAKRFLGLSRQTVAIAASVLLVPGAWYGIRVVLPPKPPLRYLAMQANQPVPTATYLNDDVPHVPDVSFTKASGSRPAQTVSGPSANSDDSLTLPYGNAIVLTQPGMGASADGSQPATHETGVLYGARNAEAAIKAFEYERAKQSGGNSGGKGQKGDVTVESVASSGVAIFKGEEKSLAEVAQLVDKLSPGSEPQSDRAGSKPDQREKGPSSQVALNGQSKPIADDEDRLRTSVKFGDGVQPGDKESGNPREEAEGEKSGSDKPGQAGSGESNSGQPHFSKRAADSGPRDGKSPNQYYAEADGEQQAGKKGSASDGPRSLALLESMPQSNGKPGYNGDGKSKPAAALSSAARGDASPPRGGTPSKESGIEVAELEKRFKSPDQLSDRYITDLEGGKASERARYADPTSNEAYKPIYENAFITSAEQQLSTFSIDVDTASYANLRRFLQNGQLPPPDAVRIEELVNYFAYAYPQPQDGRPFSVQADIATCPWQPSHQLVRVGLKGKEIPKNERPPTNLVFLVDVSGSMSSENKLPLVRESLKTLVSQLDERDKIAIVTYAGEAGLRLPSTSVAQRDTIIAAINGLGAGGSTNGAAGINTAYDIAAQEFLDKGTNRVILCTDGDFNVGVTGEGALEQMIQTRAKGGVFLSIFGFGMGNLKDDRLEMLADKGNGQYGYIDDQQEANKVFVEEMMGTLVTIAKDVKIQIDFNKEAVASYRLVGYENRVMAAQDFHNDKKDAGEIGAGHTVTALYEIVPTKDLKVDETTRWLTVKLRYKQPEATESVLFENPVTGPAGQLKLAPSDFQFAAGVAACGMLLRHSQYAGQANWGLVKELAQSGLSYDPNGHRRSFLGLVSQAESLMGQLRPASPPAPESTVRGKYKSLLRKLNAPGDTEKYGQFNDYGYSDTKSYAGSENLPAGYWVYVAPYWYIWAESNEPATKN